MLDLQGAIDLVVLHQINFSRYSTGVVQRIMATLNRADKALFGELAMLLEDAPTGITAQAEYITSMLESVRGMNAQAYAAVQQAMQADMLATAGLEAAFNGRLYGAVAGSTPLASVGAQQIYAAALSRPFQGKLLSEVFPELGQARMRRMRDAIRTGFATGKTTSDIVRELRGTKAKGFQDAFIQLDRVHLEAVVHSALSHTAATAREQFFFENRGVIKQVLWLSTLDGKTSLPCRLRDQCRYTADTHKPIGHSYPYGAGPGKFHYRCRSVSIGLLPGQEKLLGQRASADGQLDAGTTYQAWLERQTEYTQIEVLGVKRAALFREGGLKLERFADEKGNLISLEELRKKDSDAFTRAGL